MLSHMVPLCLNSLEQEADSEEANMSTTVQILPPTDQRS